MKESIRSAQTRFLLQFVATAGILILSFHVVEEFFGTLYLLPISWSAAVLLDLIGIPAVFHAASGLTIGQLTWATGGLS